LDTQLTEPPRSPWVIFKTPSYVSWYYEIMMYIRFSL